MTDARVDGDAEPELDSEGAAPPPDLGFGRLGRRAVVGGGGVLLTGAMLQTTPLGRSVLTALGFGDETSEKVKPFAHGVRVERVRRPEDLLVVDLVLVNVGPKKAKKGAPVVLQVVEKQKKAYLAIVLPGQNIGETLGKSPTNPVADSAIALPSVLAFELDREWKRPYDLARLLDWTNFKPAWKSPAGKPVSRLEVPYRLEMKPNSQSVWQHAAEPVTRAVGPKTNEVWHTRLVGKNPSTGQPDQRITDTRTVVAVESLNTKLPLALSASHRDQIVDKSSAVAPVQADRLILSSLGATLELHGRWPNTDGLLSWDHRSTLGRDQYVKTVDSGYLAPWGFRAALVNETWRAMTNRGGKIVAVQQQYTTIVLLDPLVDTSVEFARADDDLGVIHGCALPFQKVRSTVAVTGRLISGFGSGQIPTLFGTNIALTLPLVGLDWAGKEVPFTSRVMWINQTHQNLANWNALTPATREVDVLGQRTAVAEGANGSTTMPIGRMPIKIEDVTPEAPDLKRARFRPTAESLNVQVPGLSAMSSPGDSLTQPHVYHDEFLANEDNAGGIVLGLTGAGGGSKGSKGTKAMKSVASDSAGGLFKVPEYQGFSKYGGAVMGTDPDALIDAALGTFDPNSVFGGITLLAGIELTSIVPGIETITAGALAPDVPQVTHEVVDGRQVAKLSIRPTIQDATIPIATDVEIRFKAGQLSVDALIASGGTGPAEKRLEAKLVASKLQLSGLVVLPIDLLRITSATGKPLDVDVEVGDVSFLGPLAFVQQLAAIVQTILEATGQSGRSATTAIPMPGPARSSAKAAHRPGAVVRRSLEPEIDVSPSGIRVGLSLGLPDVPVGVFNLSGLGFGLGVEIGLTSPSFAVDFNFAKHDNPFVLTYGPFGGGGYVALRMLGGEVDNLEVSLLVAGGIGINLGVAAGAISVQAGFVLVLPAAKPVSLTAFFRASGCLDVLGLVSLSVVFEIALKFEDSSPSKLVGTATLQLKVKVLCCSKTVSASVSRSFAGGNKGQELEVGAASRAERAPGQDRRISFLDMYPDADPDGAWDTYVRAFAPMPA